jgi:hypothetical protein
MNLHKEEFLPDRETLELVLHEAVCPLLQTFERELHTVLATEVTLCVDMETHKLGRVCGSNRHTEDLARGELQLRFRRVFDVHRSLFTFEAIYDDGVAPGTGFTGFRSSGEVRAHDGKLEIHRRSHTARYNVREWQGWG